MLNPKEYRFMRTEILSYKELVKWENKNNESSLVKNEAHSSKSSAYFNEQIKKYQNEYGLIVEVVNMSTNTIDDYTNFGVQLLHTAHLVLYMPI